MTARYNNPWVKIWLEQVWICWQVTDVVTKTIGAELLLDPLALTERRQQPNKAPLNPLEFHGKRRSPPPQVTPPSELEQAQPRPRQRRSTC